MDTRQIIGQCNVNEIIKYWAWINENELGVVGTQSVYHISIKDINQSNNKLEAIKMFDREGPLSLSQGQVQIIRYNYSEND